MSSSIGNYLLSRCWVLYGSTRVRDQIIATMSSVIGNYLLSRCWVLYGNTRVELVKSRPSMFGTRLVKCRPRVYGRADMTMSSAIGNYLLPRCGRLYGESSGPDGPRLHLMRP